MLAIRAVKKLFLQYFYLTLDGATAQNERKLQFVKSMEVIFGIWNLEFGIKYVLRCTYYFHGKI